MKYLCTELPLATALKSTERRNSFLTFTRHVNSLSNAGGAAALYCGGGCWCGWTRSSHQAKSSGLHGCHSGGSVSTSWRQNRKSQYRKCKC
ncbi:hypothetical protein AMELA_G00262460 [Ameiurus melas]|uniref:Uncharacterized protein n=1 Tax=Ameiurus melas TaxID=219545 RepID=A0A7J5ZPG6_AMEME|nr:hypothetical protein AMELA_G00262460 [Ameiurus melas]